MAAAMPDGKCLQLQVRRDEEQEAALRSAEAAYAAAKARYNRKLAQLGVPARSQLQKLMNDKLLHRRANGLVLLRRAQHGIMKRKLEVERVVRSHRNKNGENRLRKHVKTAAERREGTVKSVVSKYNKVCAELSQLIKRRRSRSGSCPVRPLNPLPKTGIWDLDIDNPCWDDLRFDAADASAPPWMADENVRKAIRGRLLLDRCAEEQVRLAHERDNILQWFEEEWRALRAAVRAAIGAPDAPALIHQLHDRQRLLLRVGVQWERRALSIRGPSEAHLRAARQDWALASCDADVAAEHGPRSASLLDEEEGLGVGGDVDDEVDDEEDLLEAVQDIVGALYDDEREDVHARDSLADESGGEGWEEGEETDEDGDNDSWDVDEQGAQRESPREEGDAGDVDAEDVEDADDEDSNAGEGEGSGVDDEEDQGADEREEDSSESE